MHVQGTCMYMNVHVYAGIFFYGLCGFNTTGTINHVQDLTTFSSIWIFFLKELDMTMMFSIVCIHVQ
jgi:hypothetical protein